jgi:hypothetical protein
VGSGCPSRHEHRPRHEMSAERPSWSSGVVARLAMRGVAGDRPVARGPASLDRRLTRFGAALETGLAGETAQGDVLFSRAGRVLRAARRAFCYRFPGGVRRAVAGPGTASILHAIETAATEQGYMAIDARVAGRGGVPCVDYTARHALRAGRHALPARPTSGARPARRTAQAVRARPDAPWRP